MNNLDKLKAYSLGLELGIYKSEDLENFLDNIIESEENPQYIFIDALLNISKSASELQKCIEDDLFYMGCCFHDITHRKDMKKMLVQDVCNKYRSGEFCLKQTTSTLYHIAIKFDDIGSDYMFLDDYIEEVGIFYTIDYVRNVVNEFFDGIDESEDFN